MAFIYLLLDPFTAEARYVGQTRRALDVRRRAHIATVKATPHLWLSRWVASVLRRGGEPLCLLLESTSFPDERERFWIAHYREAGCKLTNLTDGGGGALGCPASDEARAKMSARAIGRRHSEAAKAKMSEKATGRRHSDAARAKMSQSKTGMKRQPFRRVDPSKRGAGNPKAKLTEAQVIEIRRRYDSGEPRRAVARDYGITRNTARLIALRQLWSHVP
jgi:hypothetical protein